MKNPNDRSFTDRQSNSANAKKALLERFKARPKADDPVMVQRREEREAIARAGQAFVLDHATYRQRAREILSAMG